MSTPTGHIKEEFPNNYGLKECYVVLNQLIPLISAIKQEQCPEEENYFEDSFAKKESFAKDFKDGHLPKVEFKEEPTAEESSCSETEEEDWFEVTKSQNRNVSTKKLSTDHLPYQCKLCNYVFGIKSSFIDHEKKCKEAFSLSTLLGKRQQTEKEDQKQFVCCEKLFPIFQHFISHKFSDHKIEYLVCGLCDKEEETPLRLHRHYTKDHFPGCNTLFKYQYIKKKKWKRLADSLVSKSQNHNVSTQQLCTDHLPYQCKLCNCVFGIKSSFIDHEENCKKTSNESTVSQKQQKTKTEDEKQFICCEKIFSIFQLFNAHKFSAHGIEFLACGLCDKKEKTPFILYKHYINDHFPGCRTLLENKSLKKKKKTADSLVTSSRNEEECTAAQEGILCQCAVCDRKKTKDTSVCRPYVCQICNFRFTLKSHLNKHIRLHDNPKRYPCDICAKAYTTPRAVKDHKLTKHNSDESPFKVNCNICFKKLGCKSTLLNHVKNVHLHLNKGKKFPCPHCSKVLSCKDSLADHIKFHLKDSQYICDYCNKVFFRRELIINHIHSQHLYQGPVKCDICGHVYKTILSLKTHKSKKHSNETFSCEICGKFAGRKWILDKHMITHLDERPFVCQTCGKTFKREVNLTQHQYSHSKERPHVCDICGQSFLLRTHVKQHMAVHGIGDNHKCSLCSKFFARKTELNLHMSVHEVPT